MKLRQLIIIVCACYICGCSNPPKRNSNDGDPYGVKKRERLRVTEELSKDPRLKYEMQKLLKKSQDSISNVTETTTPSRKLTPDDAYDLGYEEGHFDGYDDGKSGHSHGSNYNYENDFYNYYYTKYCEGYEEGYEMGYEEGQSDLKKSMEED